MKVKPKGFASMDPDKQRQIARKGGLAAHQSGAAYTWTSEAARKAALASHESRRQRAAKHLNTMRIVA